MMSMYMTMRTWRLRSMNDQEIVKHMIDYIEQKERQVASNKLAATTQSKGDVVKAILDELERVTTNENQ